MKAESVFDCIVDILSSPEMLGSGNKAASDLGMSAGHLSKLRNRSKKFPGIKHLKAIHAHWSQPDTEPTAPSFERSAFVSIFKQKFPELAQLPAPVAQLFSPLEKPVDLLQKCIELCEEPEINGLPGLQGDYQPDVLSTCLWSFFEKMHEQHLVERPPCKELHPDPEAPYLLLEFQSGTQLFILYANGILHNCSDAYSALDQLVPKPSGDAKLYNPKNKVWLVVYDVPTSLDKTEETRLQKKNIFLCNIRESELSQYKGFTVRYTGEETEAYMIKSWQYANAIYACVLDLLLVARNASMHSSSPKSAEERRKDHWHYLNLTRHSANFEEEHLQKLLAERVSASQNKLGMLAEINAEDALLSSDESVGAKVRNIRRFTNGTKTAALLQGCEMDAAGYAFGPDGLDPFFAKGKADVLVMGLGTASYMRDLTPWLQHMRNWVKPGGWLYLSFYNEAALHLAGELDKSPQYDHVPAPRIPGIGIQYLNGPQNVAREESKKKVAFPIPLQFHQLSKLSAILSEFFCTPQSAIRFTSYPFLSALAEPKEHFNEQDLKRIRNLDKMNSLIESEDEMPNALKSLFSNENRENGYYMQFWLQNRYPIRQAIKQEIRRWCPDNYDECQPDTGIKATSIEAWPFRGKNKTIWKLFATGTRAAKASAKALTPDQCAHFFATQPPSPIYCIAIHGTEEHEAYAVDLPPLEALVRMVCPITNKCYEMKREIFNTLLISKKIESVDSKTFKGKLK